LRVLTTSFTGNDNHIFRNVRKNKERRTGGEKTRHSENLRPTQREEKKRERKGPDSRAAP